MQTLDPPLVSALAALFAAMLMVYAGLGKRPPLLAARRGPQAAAAAKAPQSQEPEAMIAGGRR